MSLRSELGRVHWKLRSLYGRHAVTIDNTRITFAIRTWQEYGTYTRFTEEPYISCVMDWLNTDDVFLDVGANRGKYSLFAAGVGADVYAVEPQPAAIEAIEQHLTLNDVPGTVTLVAAAASDSCQPIGIHRSKSGDERASVGGDDLYVGGIRGDALPVTPDVVKIDVEGHELAVIDGLDGVLDEVSAVLCEVHAPDAGDHDHAVERSDVVKRLNEYGFNIEVLREEKGENPIMWAT